MIAAFIHELKFIKNSKGELFIRGYNTEYWERYLRYFDKLYVLGRVTKGSDESVSGLEKFEDPRLVFYEVPSVHSASGFLKNNKAAHRKVLELVQMVDCIVARQPGLYSSYAIAYCKKLNIPYLVEMVGCAWDALWNYDLKGKIIAPSSTLRTKRIVKNSPYVIYVTNEFLQRRYPTLGESTNCSNVTLPELSDSVLNNRLRYIESEMNMMSLKIGTVAAVDVKYKGQQYVIEAIADLRKRGINSFEYHLVGGGDQSYLRNIAKEFGVEDKVTFHGSLSHENVFKFLDNMDLYVQPSLQEGLPRALIEAMSRGLPCFGAKTGGIPELLDSEYIFENNSKRKGQIINILKNFSAKLIREQAVKNYETATGYEAEKIDSRRRAMFDKFINDIRNSKSNKSSKSSKSVGK
jgi:glycosyltransferase involved in cell wall biosynthesis